MNKLKEGHYYYSQDLMCSNPIQEVTRSDTRRTKVPKKRFSVKNAYISLRQTLQDYKIPCVKRTFGSGIVRVICRNVVQLDNITSIIESLLILNLIEEIGMPLDYSYKFVNLLLFLKPVDAKASIKLRRVFQKCSLKYHSLVLHIKYPTEQEKAAITEKANAIAPMDNVSKIIILIIILGLLVTSALTRM